MSERFYLNCPLHPGPVLLQGPEAHHLAVVCRLRPGQQVSLFNGDGSEYPATIVEANKKAVTLDVHEALAQDRELGFRLWAAVPLPRGDRGAFLVEKLTELGVTDFIPLRTRRSVLHPGDARSDRLRRAVVEASKQCGRNVLMRVEAVHDWADLCQRGDLPARRFVGHLGGSPVHEAAKDRTDAAFAVGPEGGLVEDEVALAINAGWQPLNLGKRILRVETAAIVLASWASSLAAGDIGVAR